MVLKFFAVDPDRAAMTTKLAGADTRFLPFNVGHAGGAGNSVNPDGHRTSTSSRLGRNHRRTGGSCESTKARTPTTAAQNCQSR